MSDNYNEILKEKKVYKDPVVSHKHRFFKLSLLIGVLVAIIVVGISYLVYYNTILDSESIFLNNIVKLANKYRVVVDNIKPNYDLSGNYTLDGSITIGDANYNYTFVSDGGKLMRTFNNNNKSVTYYYDNDLSYINVSGLGDTYVEVDNKLKTFDDYKNSIDSLSKNFYNYIYDSILGSSPYDLYNSLYNVDNYDSLINNIKTNFSTEVSSDKYIKKFYLENKEPIVEVNLELSKNDINNILGSDNNLEIDDDLEVALTMKNNAIDNSIKSIKVVINNKTDNTREVINYQGNVLLYTDNEGAVTKIEFKENDNKFEIRVSKNDILYSVLSSTRGDGDNSYSYHIIDKIYSVDLEFIYDDVGYNYSVESNIDSVVNNFEIGGSYAKVGSIELGQLKTVKYDDLSENEKILFNKSIREQLFGN